MTLGSAVKVIKIISKKRSKSEIDAYRGEFVEGAQRLHNIPRKVTGLLFDEILEFAGYGFNKAHSAAYGLVAYQTAYLKANYPAEFYTAYLTSEMENHAKLALIVTEMKERGLKLAPPCINRSGVDFTISAEGAALPVIRFGLAGIKGVGRSAAEHLVAIRDAGPATTLFEFCTRLDPKLVNKGTLEALLGSGALDSLQGHRAQKRAILDTCLEAAKDRQEDAAKGQTNLFDAFAASAPQAQEIPLPDVPESPEHELLLSERQLTGLFLTRHPLEQHAQAVRDLISHQIGLLGPDEDGATIRLAGLVSGFQQKTSRNGAAYGIAVLEDLTGALEMLVFPQAYEQCRGALRNDAMVVCAGRLQAEERETGGAEQEESAERQVRLKFLCDDVLPLEAVLGGQRAAPPLPKGSQKPRRMAPPPVVDLDGAAGLDDFLPGTPTVLLEVALNGNLGEFAAFLQDFIREHPGASPVRLLIRRGDERIVAELGSSTMTSSEQALRSLATAWPDLAWRVEG